VTEVQRLLGHSSPAITLKVYSHWFEGAESGSADRLAHVLFGKDTAGTDGHFLDTAKVESV